MTIKTADIQPEGLTLNFSQKLDLFDTGSASTEVSGILAVKPAGKGVLHITGRIQATPLLECSRCLKSFPWPVDAEFAFDLAPLEFLGSAPEHELGKGELEIEFYQGNELDPAELVREQVLMALPMVPLHRPDCKGLCSICGADKNETPCSCRDDSFGPFSALKNVLK